jgi:threonylcarbamoyladenosine tRNA methylthiotransferase MtaB
VTLGCKVNQYETEYLRQGLALLGYREPAEGETAELCVVNTCTVTGKADLKSRKLIRQLARQNPGTEIIVMGCYATRAADQLASLPSVAEVITDKRRLPDLLARFGLVDIPDGLKSFGRRHRANIKVQDGCRMECSYCIIPKVRPALLSRPAPTILEEVRRLVDHGHREIVLTGIHLGHYGVDLVSGERCNSLHELVEQIVGLPGEFRVRISSMEAAEVTPELIALMASHPERICPHLHLSMQSGSDMVLRRMQRRYTSREFIGQCLRAQEALDTPALTTDAIVGFPGETEADFEATCRVVAEVGFSKIHVFRFSPREGTPAATMPDRVPPPVRQRRGAELARLGERLRQSYFESLVGRTLQVLVESPQPDEPGHLTGTSSRYAPVELSGPEELLGQFVEVTACSVINGTIQGEAVRKPR